MTTGNNTQVPTVEPEPTDESGVFVASSGEKYVIQPAVQHVLVAYK
jgi:hypothetical protein